jgi:cellulose synthase/poly-beta-1,6-N-acetylglucosamine synthase-like glycosyltransferase
MGSVWVFILIWGVWLITPILVDGTEAVYRLIRVRYRQDMEIQDDEPIPLDELPTVSVIVPAHNEAEVIDRCLNSVKTQDYPVDLLEIIVIDDGSTDETAERVEEHVNGTVHDNGDQNGFRRRGEAIKVGPYSGSLELIKNGHQGKAHALNAGIERSTGDIVINIDSDVVLAEDAIKHIAEAFVRDPELGAATGNIEIDWDILEERDEEGRIVLDEEGNIVPRDLTLWERFLVKSQFLEYLSSFDLGRRAQAISNTMYTLAGACSAFRRSALEDTDLYDNTTVSEDTSLTFDLHRMGVRIGFVQNAKVYVEPVTDWDSLYAQRVRWARGQLEVCGLNEDMVGGDETASFSRVAVPRMLLYDHTLAFPRLIWAPLILFFPMIGYSWRLVAIAIIALYVFYMILEIVNALSEFAVSDEETRKRMEDSAWTLIGLPVYRFVVFHFRFSGFLVTYREQQQWTMKGPMSSTLDDVRSLRLQSVRLLSSIGLSLAVVAGRLERGIVSSMLALLVAVTAAGHFIIQSFRKYQ